MSDDRKIEWRDKTSRLPPRTWRGETEVRVRERWVGRYGKKDVCKVHKSLEKGVTVRPFILKMKVGRRYKMRQGCCYYTLEQAMERAEHYVFGPKPKVKKKQTSGVKTQHLPVSQFAALCGAREETILKAISMGYIRAAHNGEQILVHYDWPATGFVKRVKANGGELPEGLPRWLGRLGDRVRIVNNIEINLHKDRYYGYTPDGQCFDLGADLQRAVDVCMKNIDYKKRSPYNARAGKAVRVCLSYYDLELLKSLVPRDKKHRLLREKIDRTFLKSVETRKK